MPSKARTHFGYGHYIDGAYTYGFKTKEKCYALLRRSTNFRDAVEWKVFKIDRLGFHVIQSWFNANKKGEQNGLRYTFNG